MPELSRHVNEDEHGRGVLCFECGQQHRGDCEETLSRHGSCLTCRAPFFVTAEVIERLLQLVARAPGRHTPMAQNIVGGMYENDQGLETWLPKDLTKAARLYRLAVNQGCANAQCNLGVMFENGAGVPQDFKQAARWYRLAADQGHGFGQRCLANMYAMGTGVPQDLDEWARLLSASLASDQASPYSRLSPPTGPRCRPTTRTCATQNRKGNKSPDAQAPAASDVSAISNTTSPNRLWFAGRTPCLRFTEHQATSNTTIESQCIRALLQHNVCKYCRTA